MKAIFPPTSDDDWCSCQLEVCDELFDGWLQDGLDLLQGHTRRRQLNRNLQVHIHIVKQKNYKTSKITKLQNYKITNLGCMFAFPIIMQSVLPILVCFWEDQCSTILLRGLPNYSRNFCPRYFYCEYFFFSKQSNVDLSRLLYNVCTVYIYRIAILPNIVIHKRPNESTARLKRDHQL